MSNFYHTPRIRLKFTLTIGVLYFTWREIVEFAETIYKPSKTIYDIASNFSKYFNGGSGDWKAVKNGARGYLLVSMEGIPYWADAVGQIPYALYAYKTFLKQCGLPIQEVENSVIYWGNVFASGEKLEAIKNIFLSFFTNIDDNTYDNTMIKRGIKFAHKKYKRVMRNYTKAPLLHRDTLYKCEWQIQDTKINPNNLILDFAGKSVL